MAYPKGKPRPVGAGRVAGVPNKATRNAREAVSAFIDGQTERLDALLTAIEAKDGPNAAWRCIVDMMEFALPKLARSEMTGKDGGPIVVTESDKALLDRYNIKP